MPPLGKQDTGVNALPVKPTRLSERLTTPSILPTLFTVQTAVPLRPHMVILNNNVVNTHTATTSAMHVPAILVRCSNVNPTATGSSSFSEGSGLEKDKEPNDHTGSKQESTFHDVYKQITVHGSTYDYIPACGLPDFLHGQAQEVEEQQRTQEKTLELVEGKVQVPENRQHKQRREQQDEEEEGEATPTTTTIQCAEREDAAGAESAAIKPCLHIEIASPKEQPFIIDLADNNDELENGKDLPQELPARKRKAGGPMARARRKLPVRDPLGPGSQLHPLELDSDSDDDEVEILDVVQAGNQLPGASGSVAIVIQEG